MKYSIPKNLTELKMNKNISCICNRCKCKEYVPEYNITGLCKSCYQKHRKQICKTCKNQGKIPKYKVGDEINYLAGSIPDDWDDKESTAELIKLKILSETENVEAFSVQYVIEILV